MKKESTKIKNIINQLSIDIAEDDSKESADAELDHDVEYHKRQKENKWHDGQGLVIDAFHKAAARFIRWLPWIFLVFILLFIVTLIAGKGFDRYWAVKIFSWYMDILFPAAAYPVSIIFGYIIGAAMQKHK